MQCPACGKVENEVIDSRPMKDGIGIRRRRRCLPCGGRFTTFESTEERLLSLLMKRHAGQGMSKKDVDSLLSFTSRAFRGLAEGMEKLVEKPEKTEKPQVVEKPKKEIAVKTAKEE